MRRLVVLLALLMLLATAADPAQAGRDVLTIGIGQYPASLHPSIESMVARSYVLGLARRPFTVYDADWKLVCMLCTAVPTLENGGAWTETTPDGKDGIAVRYTIVAGAAWADGTPVTSRDVVFTREVGRHPRSGVMPKEFWRSLSKIDVEDERTFVLHFDRRHFDYNAINDFELLPEHIEAAAFAEPDAYPTRTRYATDPTNPGLYNGPYRVAEVAPGSHIVLVRNAYWKGPAPEFERIVVRAIENTAALEANLLSGAIDMIAGEIGLTLDQAEALQARHRDRFQVIFKPSLAYEHIDLNLDNPDLADVRVRQALLLALDREAISRQLFAGRQPVADSNVSPLDRMAAADVRRWPYDPAAAAALFAAAGWGRLVNGVRVDAAGRPLRVELMTTAGDRTRELVQQVLQSQWKAAGIDVRIRNQPARVFFGETVSRRQFGSMALFAWFSAPESVPRTTLHASEIPTEANGWSGQNYTGFRNAEMDGLIEAIETELDEGKRRALWGRLQALYAEQLPALPLWWRANAFVLPAWLDGVRPTGHQYPTTLWVEEWRTR
ncbi:MAG: peptide ABC transporter substrate-binding protein [Rhodospirillales bacterium]|nr:peptide ABC transporter substrate-binding protein [Rhodospirillales bacterium]